MTSKSTTTWERLQKIRILNYLEKISWEILNITEKSPSQCPCPTINNYSTLAGLFHLFLCHIPRSTLSDSCPYPKTPHAASHLGLWWLPDVGSTTTTSSHLLTSLFVALPPSMRNHISIDKATSFLEKILNYSLRYRQSPHNALNYILVQFTPTAKSTSPVYPWICTNGILN